MKPVKKVPKTGKANPPTDTDVGKIRIKIAAELDAAKPKPRIRSISEWVEL